MRKYIFLNKKIFVGLSILILSVFLPVYSVYAAGVPTILSFQGRLTDSSGNLLGGSGTNYYFKFSIWDMATGGTAPPDRLWPAGAPGVTTASVRQGVFNVNIGDTASGYPDVLNYNFNTNKDIYLQIEVSSNNVTFETLSPRQRIASAPFAQVSGAVNGTGQSSFGTTTPASDTVVTIEAPTTTSVPALIRASIGQVADLFKINDSSSNNLFSINSLGGIFGASTLTIGSPTSFIVNSSGDVGVGTGSPGRKLDVLKADSNPQLRLSQSNSVYGELYADPSGDLQVSSTGGNIRNQNENLWVCSGGSCGVSSSDVAGEGNIIVENSIILDNKFKLKQTGPSTTTMYDSGDNPILEFDEGQ